MELKTIRKEIGKGVHLNVLKTDKFKTNIISIYLIRPLDKEEVTKNALLPLVLNRGTKNYNTSLDIQRKLEDLYGANLSIDVSKKGEKHAIRFSIEFIDDKYTNERNIEETISLLIEIIINPILENGKFSTKYIQQEKENLKRRIESKINDKKQYSVDRCIEEMCKDEKFSINRLGYVDDLEKVNADNLYEHYKTVLSTSIIEIDAVGDINITEVEELIKNKFNLERKNIVELPREEVIKKVEKENVVYEDMEISQGKLILGYRTNLPYEDELYNAFMIGNEILGGGPNSKLFLNVREKESLAYYIYSQSFKYKSLMLIVSGIEFENFEKTVDIIKSQVDEVKKGVFTEDDIENAKNSIITSIKALTDDSFSLCEYILAQYLTNDDKTIDEFISNIRKVRKEDIVNAFQNIELDTTYFLKSK
ncbi:putative Zn-dependent peptidase [Gottschalkia purinilytica]|uniref:Putative Zn-dependent peptidase n=1 Tax=Gottschalkia purinilytica TaxID=1503 RepID=A0A0L0WEM8_GOTPU|nr:pitrilysin family protein [Gottschalkia purinilytica]KNF09933.1 putative Zn-dependent peptidase [Gottschalkia purinilytica]